jgi:hypothetical protein
MLKWKALLASIISHGQNLGCRVKLVLRLLTPASGYHDDANRTWVRLAKNYAGIVAAILAELDHRIRYLSLHGLGRNRGLADVACTRSHPA